MTTANDIIIRAFSRIGIRETETSVTSDELKDALSLLNDMLAEWEPIYGLGMSPVKASGDTITVPRYAELAIKENLAIRLAPEYSRPISPALVASAKQSTDNLLNIILNLSNVDIPSSLPVGSGNECNDGNKRTYFPQPKSVNF